MPLVSCTVTMNHLEHLDPMLSCPGCMDIWVKFKNMSKWQCKALFHNFFPSSEDFFLSAPVSTSASTTPSSASTMFSSVPSTPSMSVMGEGDEEFDEDIEITGLTCEVLGAGGEVKNKEWKTKDVEKGKVTPLPPSVVDLMFLLLKAFSGTCFYFNRSGEKRDGTKLGISRVWAKQDGIVRSESGSFPFEVKHGPRRVVAVRDFMGIG
ncbi:hypothetical protein K439DRAFT_1559063 [Ramaria rubella]|nr:hypothetical protein K439DRAFT_1559063 [Ramaria rubella]